MDYGKYLRATRLVNCSQLEGDRAYARAVFNVVFNRRDEHAKRFSYLLGEDPTWRLLPA